MPTYEVTLYRRASVYQGNSIRVDAPDERAAIKLAWDGKQVGSWETLRVFDSEMLDVGVKKITVAPT